jgi:hypothetical protein
MLFSSLRAERAMDVRTYHTLMMGHTKLLQHLSVLQLYDEALASGIQVCRRSVTLGSLIIYLVPHKYQGSMKIVCP